MFYEELTPELKVFIEEQKMFFVATAPDDGRINLSPKGLDTLCVHSPKRLNWLNLTGSGNETAAHILENGRITVMFCSFSEKPWILRIYGRGRSIHQNDVDWDEMIQLFPDLPGARQIIDIQIDSVQTSCGFGVPQYKYAGGRGKLERWAEKKGERGIIEYWEKKNSMSIDGQPTGI